MTAAAIGKAERVTQNRIIKLFRDDLDYRYLSDWSDRADNSNIEDALVTEHLTLRLLVRANQPRHLSPQDRSDKPEPQPVRQQ